MAPAASFAGVESFADAEPPEAFVGRTVPQLLQNFALSLFVAPQPGQTSASGAPHWSQNRAP